MSKRLNADYYKTTDLTTCVILQYFNHQFLDVDKSNPTRCIFRLRKRKDTEKILDSFYKGALSVEPKRFNSIQREIKSRLYNE